MRINYQIILLGHLDSTAENFTKQFFERVDDLGLPRDSMRILSSDDYENNYKLNSPSVCLYFGKGEDLNKDFMHLKQIKEDSNFIIPIVPDLKNFNSHTPELIRDLNGFESKTSDSIPKLVNHVLENLSLLRTERRLFISYRRVESRNIAVQLYEYFEQFNYDVFLDTHSVKPGEPFQDELWHRMVDTDVVVILNTPGFLESTWTEQELAQASAMSIGIVQVVWPKTEVDSFAALSLPVYLNDNSFNGKELLSDSTLKEISNEVESHRARSLAAREDNLIREFISTSKNLKLKTTLHSEKIVAIENSGRENYLIIPTIGLPKAFTLNKKEDLIRQIWRSNSTKLFLLYDHRNIRDNWQKHLNWLNDYLPVRSIKVTEVEEWLRKEVI